MAYLKPEKVNVVIVTAFCRIHNGETMLEFCVLIAQTLVSDGEDQIRLILVEKLNAQFLYAKKNKHEYYLK